MSVSTMSSSLNIQHVLIGEIRIASNGILKATLGSCVAVALIDRKRGLCGLAHCLLPYATQGSQPGNARFADRALQNLLLAGGWDTHARRRLKGFLAGGARMIPENGSNRLTVGDMNVSAAQASFDEHNIPYNILEVGGTEGYSVIVDCDTQTVTCSKIRPMTTEEEETPWS
jgi:chemotaxis protein CheD